MSEDDQVIETLSRPGNRADGVRTPPASETAEALLDAVRAYGDARADVAYGRATRKAIDHAWERLLAVGHIPPMDRRDPPASEMVEAAWEALASTGGPTHRAEIARHRPLIEAAIRAESAGTLDGERLARLIVSYADLTHEVVWSGGDWRDIAKEWAGVVDECRIYLARLAEADRG